MLNEPILSVEDVFRPLVGHFAWTVRRGYGTFLTLEFGSPHLRVRQPIKASADASLEVKRLLARRRVHVTGDWHLWVEHADWCVRTTNYAADNGWDDAALVDRALEELAGQILISATAGETAHSCLLSFDLGGSLAMAPSATDDGDQWSIHMFDVGSVSYGRNGEIVIEKL